MTPPRRTFVTACGCVVGNPRPPRQQEGSTALTIAAAPSLVTRPRTHARTNAPPSAPVCLPCCNAAAGHRWAAHKQCTGMLRNIHNFLDFLAFSSQRTMFHCPCHALPAAPPPPPLIRSLHPQHCTPLLIFNDSYSPYKTRHR